jgi:hypothetical protein
MCCSLTLVYIYQHYLKHLIILETEEVWEYYYSQQDANLRQGRSTGGGLAKMPKVQNP